MKKKEVRLLGAQLFKRDDCLLIYNRLAAFMITRIPLSRGLDNKNTPVPRARQSSHLPWLIYSEVSGNCRGELFDRWKHFSCA